MTLVNPYSPWGETISDLNLLPGAVWGVPTFRAEKRCVTVCVCVCALDVELPCNYNIMTHINRSEFLPRNCGTLLDALISELLMLWPRRLLTFEKGSPATTLPQINILWLIDENIKNNCDRV